MNLKIKCDTPKEQVLVLRKFKKLVPECRWSFGKEILDFMPFIEYQIGVTFLYLEAKEINYDFPDSMLDDPDLPEFTASDFLRDDWKLEEEKKPVRCSWDVITKLEKDGDSLAHMKLYTSDFSPNEVEIILNEHLKNNKQNPNLLTKLNNLQDQLNELSTLIKKESL